MQDWQNSQYECLVSQSAALYEHSLRNDSAYNPARTEAVQLTVTLEQRRAEIAELVAEHQLFADIHITEDSDSEENVAELMALVNRAATLTAAKTPNRNEPCSCGSGEKYKKCCA